MSLCIVAATGGGGSAATGGGSFVVGLTIAVTVCIHNLFTVPLHHHVPFRQCYTASHALDGSHATVGTPLFSPGISTKCIVVQWTYGYMSTLGMEQPVYRLRVDNETHAHAGTDGDVGQGC